MDDLPKEYDIIVVGTGFIECLVAAAAARVGKKVLHLDKNEYYGGPWASFTLQAIEDWLNNLDQKGESQVNNEPVLDDGETFKFTSNPDRMFSNVHQSWHIPEEIIAAPPTKKLCSETISKEETQVDDKDDDCDESSTPSLTTSGTEDCTQDGTEESLDESDKESKSVSEDTSSAVNSKQRCSKELMTQSRKFNLDLTAKLLYSRGSLVELLISSNVARYMEFKGTTKILTWMNSSISSTTDDSNLTSVPCSRSDVFKTNSLSLIEKRLLMKFLEICYKYEDNKSKWEEFEQQPFVNFLKFHKLTPKLIHYVTAAIAMVSPDVPSITGLEKMKLFLSSLGRFGASPFLFCMYGCGELPQAFCRLCAVFEGIYILRRGVEAIVLGEGEVKGVLSEGDRIKCSHLVMQAAAAPSLYTTSEPSCSVSRGIFITDKSLSTDDSDQLTLLRFPKDDLIPNPITVLEVCSGAGVCPKDLYVIHMTCEGSNAEQDLSVAVKRLFNSDEKQQPQILWSLYFNQMNFSSKPSEQTAKNLHFCSGPDAKLDYDDAIDQARDLFSKIYPEEEFLPRAPDPEEIIFDTEDTQQSKEESLDVDVLAEATQDKEEDKPEENVDNDQANSETQIKDKNLSEPLECSNPTSVIE